MYITKQGMVIPNTRNIILCTLRRSPRETCGLTLISDREDIKYLEGDINRYL